MNLNNKINAMNKILIALLILVSSIQRIEAQQDAVFTHYMYNTLGVNSAYAGSRDVVTATLLHRTQWAALDGAPETQTFTIHSPLSKEKLGMGLSVINEKIGPSKNTAFYTDVSYRIMITQKSRLAFGLKAGFNMFKTSFQDLDIGDVYDESFEGGEIASFMPNFGFGVYYDTKNFYLGLSTPHILENKYSGTEAAEKMHYYLTAGMIKDITKSLKIKPSILVKATDGAPIQADVTALFIIKEKFNLGVKYRTRDAMGVLLGIDLNEVFSLGYSFDWSTNNSWNNAESTIQRTSHELMLRYEFNYKNKVRSPRYF